MRLIIVRSKFHLNWISLSKQLFFSSRPCMRAMCICSIVFCFSTNPEVVLSQKQRRNFEQVTQSRTLHLRSIRHGDKPWTSLINDARTGFSGVMQWSADALYTGHFLLFPNGTFRFRELVPGLRLKSSEPLGAILTAPRSPSRSPVSELDAKSGRLN